MNFQSFDLNTQIIKAVLESGYKEPTLIQQEAIPFVLKGLDIRGSAQTGTGKTAAFLLPTLHRLSLSESPKKGGPRLLVLVPTRELGMQIAVQAEKYSKYLPHLKTVCISGGIPYHKQLPKISRPHDILIATPGRLIDFMQQGKISLARVEILVLDEADRMLDMGFLPPVEKIVAAMPAERQTLLFSATLSKEVVKLSSRILKNPTDVIVHPTHAKHENIEQKLYYVKSLENKNTLLEHILSKETSTNTLIFTATKRHADQLASDLCDKGYAAGALHGDMNQRQRTQMVRNVRQGTIKILVATDVAARGLDIDSITHVINFDFPQNPEDYVHRIGRTGRAGAKGVALSFASNRDKEMLKRIEQLTHHPLEVVQLPGFTQQQQQPKSPKKSRPKRQGFFKKKKRFAAPTARHSHSKRQK